MCGNTFGRPLEDALAHSQAFGKGHPVSDLGYQDRHAAFCSYHADLPPDYRVPYFAGYHKPTFEGVFVPLGFLNLFYGEIGGPR